MLGADSVPLGATELCVPARLLLSIVCAIRRFVLFRYFVKKPRYYSNRVALHGCVSVATCLETRSGASRGISSAETTTHDRANGSGWG